MPLLDLRSATGEIHQAIDQKRRRGLPSPFFFMVGAGISYPPVPLAAQIQDHCKEEAGRYGKTTQASSDTSIDSYSYWFEQAYQQPENRQQYLRELMENAFISRANFRLAHLLLDKTVTNLVVTSNFDDFLSRALTLFGRRPTVCDHPRTLERIDLQSPDVQIIHLHGSYWFYDCCNLKYEIGERARIQRDTSLTMSSLLESLLWAHSPLVVGYSGWEGDVFMTALQRRLSTGLRTRLYWFCYKRRDAQALPQWLISDPNVFVVVPDERKKADLPDSGQPTAISANAPRAKAHDSDAYSLSGSNPDEPFLRATDVFDQMIQAFKLDAPPLTKDPLTFYAKHLKASLLGDKSDELENDVYAIRSVIESLERLKASAGQLPVSKTESRLESFRNAVRQSKQREAIRIAKKIPIGKLTPEQLREVMSALSDAALGLFDNSQDELDSYDLIVAFSERLAALGLTDYSTGFVLARSLFRKGVRLGALHRSEEAIVAYEELLRRFGDATEAALGEWVAKALLNKGVRLSALNRSEEAIEAYKEVLGRFGDATETALREQVANALINKGITLGALNRGEEEIAAYEELLRRFGDATEAAVREQVAKALLNKGARLGALNRSDEAIAAYDGLLGRFGDATEAALRERVAKALLNKGVRLGALNRSEEEITAYEELLRRFGDATEAALREHVAKALLNKGATLGALNRSEEAIAAYEELLRRFGDAPEAALRERVAMALFNKGVRLGALKRSEEAIAAYEDLLRRFGDDSDPKLRELSGKATAAKNALAKKLGSA